MSESKDTENEILDGGSDEIETTETETIADEEVESEGTTEESNGEAETSSDAEDGQGVQEDEPIVVTDDEEPAVDSTTSLADLIDPSDIHEGDAEEESEEAPPEGDDQDDEESETVDTDPNIDEPKKRKKRKKSKKKESEVKTDDKEQRRPIIMLSRSNVKMVKRSRMAIIMPKRSNGE